MACKFSTENLADGLWMFFVYATLCVSLVAFRILTLPLTWLFNFAIFGGVSLGSLCLGLSVILVPGYLFSSLGIFQL